MELYKQKESTHSLTKVCGYSLATHIALYNYDYKAFVCSCQYKKQQKCSFMSINQYFYY